MTLDNVTLIIKTFERPYCLESLLKSYIKMGWNCSIIIADDSKIHYRDSIIKKFGDVINEYICLPFDVGISVGRNTLLEKVKTPYFVLCDDDFIFDQRTNLTFMRNILETTDIELLGGLFLDRIEYYQGESIWNIIWRLLQQRKLWNCLDVVTGKETVRRFQGNYTVSNRTLSTRPITYTPPFTRCDYVHNFFMAETAAFRLRNISWNNALKINEHEAFFFEAKQKGLHVATTEEVSIIHQRILSKNYFGYRHGRGYYRKIFLKEQGFIRFIDEALGIEVVV